MEWVGEGEGLEAAEDGWVVGEDGGRRRVGKGLIAYGGRHCATIQVSVIRLTPLRTMQNGYGIRSEVRPPRLEEVTLGRRRKRSRTVDAEVDLPRFVFRQLAISRFRRLRHQSDIVPRTFRKFERSELR